MFAHDLEASVGRHPRDGNHRLLDDAADLLAVGQVLALAQVDSNEWHGLIPFRTRGSEKAERNCLHTLAIPMIAAYAH